MLKRRILTAVTLVALLIAALFYLPLGWLIVLFGFFFAAAAWEWSGLAGLRHPMARVGYLLLLLAFGASGIYSVLHQPSLIVSILTAAVAWWLWALIELISRPGINKGMFTTLMGRMAGGFLVLVPVWVACVYLLVVDYDRPRALLFLLFLVWVADTAAYFTGSVLGRTKLAPQISPGKTVEGVGGGVLGVVLLAWLCGTMIWKYDGRLLIPWIGLAVVTALFSVVGDLTESKLKRLAGVKDSGGLLPGHGGVLDRIDALTAAAPVFVLGGILFLKA
ncbi:MAG: phosphatidate cytidylyltransferase [Sulfuricaulis sp.]